MINKKEILKLVNEHEDVYTQIIKCKYKYFYQYIFNNFAGIKFGEKLYKWLNEDKSIGLCLKCNNQTHFSSIKTGFVKFCSKKCANSYSSKERAEKLKHISPDLNFWKEKICENCNIKFWSRIKQHRKFCGNKCSTIFTANSIDRLDKIKNSKLQNYGDKNYVNVEKYKQTCLKKYGVTNISKLQETKDKIKINHKLSFFKKLSTNHKLNAEYEPLFSINDYVNTDKVNKYKFKCKKCNGFFYDHIDGGHLPRCLKCNPYITSFSHAEDELYNFIFNELDFKDVIKSDRKILNPYELDLYIPSKKLAIEFNGLFWHSEIGGNKDKNYHLRKTQECEKKNIQLIHVFEDLWINNKELVKCKLIHILKKNNDNNIYARNCNIEIVNTKNKYDFLEKNHIQGNDLSSIGLGLYYKDELVSIMTFGKLRKCMGNTNINNQYEMYRFCSSKNVCGAASKLLSYFIKNYNPAKIISYADRCWSIGKLYDKIGMKFVSKTKPNYFYTSDYLSRIYRFNFRKDQLSKKLKIFDPSLTEWENMQLNGFDRIWDCGHLKYEWNNQINT